LGDSPLAGMSIRGTATIAGIYEHPTRIARETTTPELHAQVARGALADAGLELSDVDAYFCAGDAPGLGPLTMIDYLGLRVRHMDSTDNGGSAYISHVAHAAAAIATGACSVALITLAGRPRADGMTGAYPPANFAVGAPEELFESPYRPTALGLYAMAAMRHMYEYGTTSEQLAWVKVAASQHARHNEQAFLRETVTVEEVLASPVVADPLHRLDCCIVTDGGGALVVTSPELAAELGKPDVRVRGAGESVVGFDGAGDLTTTAAAASGGAAFAEAGLGPGDIDYVGLYDSFTISVILQLEDLGFCAKGDGGRFVADGNLISGYGTLPVNTDGGALCNNHPAHRGGMTKVIEAVRQLRGEAHPAVQVPDCRLAAVNGLGGWLTTRHACSTVILERAS
jgi:acetyl-CoA C-acetyltransferase